LLFDVLGWNNRLLHDAEKEPGIELLGHEVDRVRIDGGDLLERNELPLVGVLWVAHHALVGILHVLGGKRRAVVKLYTLPQFEFPCRGIELLVGFSEPRTVFPESITVKQIVKGIVRKYPFVR